MAHIMMDLETLGTKPGSVLRSVGAVVFNPKTGETGSSFYTNIDHDSCLQLGLTVDPETERWWRKQSPEVQAQLLEEPMQVNEAIRNFHAWFRSEGGDKIWSQGANFDIVLWEAVANLIGLSVPWRFWNARDTRTAYDMGNFDPKSFPREGTYHNALDDAIHQARCVGRAMGGLL